MAIVRNHLTPDHVTQDYVEDDGRTKTVAQPSGKVDNKTIKILKENLQDTQKHLKNRKAANNDELKRSNCYKREREKARDGKEKMERICDVN